MHGNLRACEYVRRLGSKSPGHLCRRLLFSGFGENDTGRRLNSIPDIPSWVFAGQIESRIFDFAAKFGATNGCMLVMTLSKFARDISNASASLFNQWPLNLD